MVATKVIEGADAPIGDQWHRYRLAAEIRNAANLTEFRVFWHGAYDLDVGSIRVHTKGRPHRRQQWPRRRSRCSIDPRPRWRARRRKRLRACIHGCSAELRLTSNISELSP